MAHQLGKEPDIEIATRTGELAMLLYSIGMFLLPNLTTVWSNVTANSGCHCGCSSSLPRTP